MNGGMTRGLADGIGGFRDRSAAYFRFRNAARPHGTQSRSLIRAHNGALGTDEDEGEHVALNRGKPWISDGSDGSAPSWVTSSETAQELMSTIKSKMAELRKLHEKALLPGFGDSHRRTEEQHIDVLTKDITRLFQQAEHTLQELSSEEKDTEGRVKKNVQRAVATDLQKLSMEFRKQQKDYLRKVRAQRADEQSSIDFGGGFGGTMESYSRNLIEDDNLDSGFTQTQLLQVEHAENFTSERDQEVQKVVESVNELAQVMKDLSVLVVDQGTVLDRIDYNCERVAASVEQGEKQLQDAESNQKQSRMMIVIFCLLIAVLIMLVIVMVKLVG